jgi:hypothetical protein
LIVQRIARFNTPRPGLEPKKGLPFRTLKSSQVKKVNIKTQSLEIGDNKGANGVEISDSAITVLLPSTESTFHSEK